MPRATELFVNAPHESISYIWQVFGCRHTLEPTDNDYEPPSIPALTLRGFVRWESIQLLLAPDEHVPFIIHAVKNWHLKNPDTGDLFPENITSAAFPSEPDPDISVWYEACGDRLRKEATPRASPRPSFPSAADRVQSAFSHVPAGSARPAATDYFTHRSVPFAHVSPGHAGPRYRGAGLRVSPERADRTRHNGMSPQEERARRRSFSDYPSPHAESYATPHLNPNRPMAARRHSHPRRVTVTTDDEESDDDMASPHVDRRSTAAYGPAHRSPRFAHLAAPFGTPAGTPPVPGVPLAGQAPSLRAEGGGAKLRPEDLGGVRRKSTTEEAKDWAKGKLSGIFAAASPSGGLSPAERPSRKSPGSSSGNVAAGGISGGSHHSLPGRMARSRSYDDGESGSDSEYERERRRRKRAREREREREQRDRDLRRERDAAYERERDREREREREREHHGAARRSREWEGDGEPRPRSRKERENREARYLRRPDNSRRTSSHADVDRLDRHHRYEESFRGERERDRYGERRRRQQDGGGGGGSLAHEADRERERDRVRDRTASPGMKGVGGRKYPAEPPWTQESPPP